MEPATPGIAGKLQVGMKLAEVTGILGEPTHTMQGGTVLGMFGSVTGSPSAISSLSEKVYCIWRRPEGEWKLVFAGGRLESIYSMPPPADFAEVLERDRLAKAEVKADMKPEEIRAVYDKYGLISL